MIRSCYLLCKYLRSYKKSFIIMFFTLMTLIGEIGQIIWLPLWLDSISHSMKSNREAIDPLMPGPYAGVSLISTIIETFLFLTIFVCLGRIKLYYSDKALIVCSLLNMVGSLLTPYFSSSNRNIPVFQSILVNFYVPFTALVRFIYLNKLPTLKKGICIVIVIIGITIGFIPNFSSGDNSSSINSHHTSWSSLNALWILGFLFFNVLVAVFVNVGVEKLLKSKQLVLKYIPFEDMVDHNGHISKLTPNGGHNHPPQQDSQRWRFNEPLDGPPNEPLNEPYMTGTEFINSDVLYVCMIMSTFQLFGSILLFWIDLIPHLGRSRNLNEYFTNMQQSIACTAGYAGCSYQTLGFATGYILSYVCAYIGGFSLILHGEGSILWSLILNMVAPSTVIFWIFFCVYPFRWCPHFDRTSIFSIISILFMLPALVIYNISKPEHTFRWVPSKYKICGMRLKKMEIVCN